MKKGSSFEVHGTPPPYRHFLLRLCCLDSSCWRWFEVWSILHGDGVVLVMDSEPRSLRKARRGERKGRKRRRQSKVRGTVAAHRRLRHRLRPFTDMPPRPCHLAALVAAKFGNLRNRADASRRSAPSCHDSPRPVPLLFQPHFMFKHLKKDLPASIVVFLVALPLCLGIALASGAPPLAGLIAGILGGLVVAPISGSAVGVSGPLLAWP